MSFDTTSFRQKYRAEISTRYSAGLHGGFVLAVGLLVIACLARHIDHVTALEWLTVPVTVVFWTWAEYRAHKFFGHHKNPLCRPFYKSHTGDHHSFFVDGQMRYEFAKDWRVILFPAWLILLFSCGAIAAGWLISRFDSNIGILFSMTLVSGYLSYEFFHACEHLPPEHPVSRLPWIRQMRRLHELHHRRDLMQTHNFNVVLPLMDWLLGTLYWEPETSEEGAMTRMTHEVEISRDAGQVLDYAATVAHWPDWHPSSLRISAAAGPLAAGARFEENIVAGGQPACLNWTVCEYQPGRLWRAKARGNRGLSLQVTYESSACANGARFVRTLTYGFDGWSMRMANLLILRRRVERESLESMERLRRAAESHLAKAA
jgi:hypothetical protein